MRYIIGFLVTIGLIVLIFVLLLRGGGQPAQPNSGPSLPSYADTDTLMQMTIDEPINAASKHRQIQVTVGRDDVTVALMQGYSGHVLREKSYSNSQDAYAAFLYALARAGYDKGDNSSDLKEDRGYCPEGNRYIFEIIQNGHDIQRYWTTNCGGPHSFQGDKGTVLTLFQRQVPDYDEVTGGLGSGLY